MTGETRQRVRRAPQQPPDTLPRRLRVACSLIVDVNLDELRARYGGLDSVEHDEVQTLIAFAREIRELAYGTRRPSKPEDGAESGSCSLCGQVMIRTADDCWHPWDVDRPCPPEPLSSDLVGWNLWRAAGNRTGRPGREYFIPEGGPCG